MAKPANKVAYFELPADDVARASAFYNAVFGWHTPPMGSGGVFALTTAADERGNPTAPGGINGDISPRSKGLDRPLIMILVDGVDAQLQAVKEAGGKVVHPPQAETGFGLVWAVFSDTEGNHIGLYSFGAK
jgi:predicted enzyme related to lactoylglutathione lyase